MPRSRQQTELNDMQLWQQDLTYRQMQELQRQQQLQQLDQGGIQENLLNQLSVTAKQAAVNQSPPLLNDMPFKNVSNNMLQTELMGGGPKVQSSSELFISGDTNWGQSSGSPSLHGFQDGLIFSNNQGQASQSMGLILQQPGKSLYSTPVLSNRGSLSHYTYVQGIPDDPDLVMTTTDDNRKENVPLHSSEFHPSGSNKCVLKEQGYSQDGILVSKQRFQENSSSGNVQGQSPSSGVTSGDFHQLSHQLESAQIQEFQVMQEQADWSVNKQDKASVQPPSHCVTEQKVLFGTDEGGWDASMGRSSAASTGGCLHGSPLGSNDSFGAFPSLQSGSWSALMQDAVDASSSDTGLQEEWSGLSFQKTDLSNGDHSDVLNDTEKQQRNWDDSNLHSASSLTSRPRSLFSDSDANTNFGVAPGFQHSSAELTFEQNNRVLADVRPCTLKEAEIKQLDKGDQLKQSVESGPQDLLQFDNASNGVWAGKMLEMSAKSSHPLEMGSNSNNMQAVWAWQQEMSSSNVVNQNPSDWNITESRTFSRDGSPKTCDSNESGWNAQKKDKKRNMQDTRDNDGSLWKFSGNQVNSTSVVASLKSDICSPMMQGSCIGNFSAVMDSTTLKVTKAMNQQIANECRINFGKNVPVDSFVKSERNEIVPQHRLSRKVQAWEMNMNCTNRGLGGAQKSQDQHRQNTLGSPGFQHMNMEHANSPNQASYSQGLSQSAVQGLSKQNQGDTANSLLIGHTVSKNPMVMRKMYFADLERNEDGPETQSKGSVPKHDSSMSSSFQGSNSQLSHNRMISQTSQNMLELLHKVDRFGDSSHVTCFGFPGQGRIYELPGAATSDGSASCVQQYHSSTLQDFGLPLAAIPQQQRVSNQDLPSQASVYDINSSQLDSEAGGKDGRWSTSPQSLPVVQEGSQREGWENKCDISEQICKEISRTQSHGNSLVVAAPTLPCIGKPLQQEQQHKSAPTSPEVLDQSVDHSFGSLVDVDVRANNARHSAQSYDSYGGASANQPVQAPISSVAGRTPPSRLSSPDPCAAVALKFQSFSTSHSLHMKACFPYLQSSQLVSAAEAKSISQASATSGMSLQPGMSSALPDVWTHVSSECLSGLQPHKFTHHTLQSVIPSTSSKDENLWTVQKADNQSNKGGSSPPGFDTSSGSPHCMVEDPVKKNSSQLISSNGFDDSPNAASSCQGQEPVPKHLSDGNSANSALPLVCLKKHDSNKGKPVHDSSLFSQMEHPPAQKIASSIGTYGRTSKLSNHYTQNYSLLQQMQAMKGADSGPSKRVEKRFKGDEYGSDTSTADWRTAQRLVDGQNSVFRVPADNELSVSSPIVFPSDVKMLNFSSRETEEKSANSSSQLVSKEVSSQDLHISGERDHYSHTHSLNLSSYLVCTEGSEPPSGGPQMASSWLEQYGNYKDGQNLAINGQKRAKFASQGYLSANVSEDIDDSAIVEVRNDTSQITSQGESTLCTTVTGNESSSPSCLLSTATNHNIVLGPRKRKTATSQLLPWHKEVTQGPGRLPSASIAESEWAWATNRKFEKVGDEVQMVEDGKSMHRPKRRLVLTTQLMQQLLPSAPPAILKEEATSAYENVTYWIAKATLGDACNLTSYSGNDCCVYLDNGNRRPDNLKSAEKVGDYLSEVVESLIGRSRKLENEFLRLDKRPSILDTILEWQELERFSIVNRLGKFHGCRHTDEAESSSTSGNAPHRTFPQRCITTHSMAGKLPEGMLCLTL